MFREMRRKKQALPEPDCLAILDRGTAGVLALFGDGGYPYAVPISYVRDGSRLYFHSAASGHKLDAAARCEKVSFCVIDRDQVVPEEYTTYFRSVIVFGRIRRLEDPGEKRRAIECLARKYAPADTAGHRDGAIDREFPQLCMLELTIEHLSGKEAIELVKNRQA